MATLLDIRTAIKNTLESAISTITVYATVPEATNLPAVVVQPMLSDFTTAMGRGTDTWEFDLFVLVQEGDLDVAQAELDGYVSGAGDTSIRQAIFLSDGLGISDTNATVQGLSAYGTQFNSASIDHLGAVLRLVVLTKGTV